MILLLLLIPLLLLLLPPSTAAATTTTTTSSNPPSPTTTTTTWKCHSPPSNPAKIIGRNPAGIKVAESEISMYGACLAYIPDGDRPADVSPRDTTGVLHRTFIGNFNSQVNSHMMFITLQALNNFHAAPCGRSRGEGAATVPCRNRSCFSSCSHSTSRSSRR